MLGSDLTHQEGDASLSYRVNVTHGNRYLEVFDSSVSAQSFKKGL